MAPPTGIEPACVRYPFKWVETTGDTEALIGVLGEIQTLNLLFRKQMFYSIETTRTLYNRYLKIQNFYKLAERG